MYSDYFVHCFQYKNTNLKRIFVIYDASSWRHENPNSTKVVSPDVMCRFHLSTALQKKTACFFKFIRKQCHRQGLSAIEN